MKEKINRFCEECQEIAAEYCGPDEWPYCIHESEAALELAGEE